jgi:hypothetical protein
MSPKTQKRSQSSPNSKRKSKKNVRFSEVPQEFVFKRDFDPDDKTLLWNTNLEYNNATTERNNEIDDSLRSILRARKQAAKHYRKSKLNELQSLKNNTEPILKRFGKIENSVSEFQPEESIQLRRQIPVKKITLYDIESPVPEKKQGFLFRILSKAKSLVLKKNGGKNKTKRHKMRT